MTRKHKSSWHEGRDHHPTPDTDAVMRPDNPFLYDGFTGGGHVGKGPKGYRRSDANIHEDLGDALTRSSEIDATDIEISVHRGEITLSGHVPDRRMKRLAEDIALNLQGVAEVHNRLMIKRQ